MNMVACLRDRHHTSQSIRVRRHWSVWIEEGGSLRVCFAVASSIAVCGREMKALDTFAKTHSWGFSSHEKDTGSTGKGDICVVVGVSLWLCARVLNETTFLWIEQPSLMWCGGGGRVSTWVAHVTLFFWDLNTQRGGVGPERLCFLEARLSGLMVKCVLKTGEVNYSSQDKQHLGPRLGPFLFLLYHILIPLSSLCFTFDYSVDPAPSQHFPVSIDDFPLPLLLLLILP